MLKSTLAWKNTPPAVVTVVTIMSYGSGVEGGSIIFQSLNLEFTFQWGARVGSVMYTRLHILFNILPQFLKFEFLSFQFDQIISVETDGLRCCNVKSLKVEGKANKSSYVQYTCCVTLPKVFPKYLSHRRENGAVIKCYQKRQYVSKYPPLFFHQETDPNGRAL